VPARWRPGTSLTRPTISSSHWISALASFAGYYQVPRAAARRLAADEDRQRCGSCFFRRDRRLTAPSANAASAGREAEAISREAAGHLCGAGAPSNSAGRAVCARSAVPVVAPVGVWGASAAFPVYWRGALVVQMQTLGGSR